MNNHKIDCNKSHLFPKIIFFDLEGTLTKKQVHLDFGRVAPSAWAAIAEALGNECLEEEKKTQEKWRAQEYPSYIAWMRDTIHIHQKFHLTQKIFSTVINAVELSDGAQDAVAALQRNGTITVIISGGFKELANRVQRILHIDHAFSGCEYYFDDLGLIEHFNLMPSDEIGKVNFMKLIADEYGVSSDDCAFVGDGMNDIHLAQAVGYSIGFNPQNELRKVVSTFVDNPNLSAVTEILFQEQERRNKL
jgi:phosphoserine phosphatase